MPDRTKTQTELEFLASLQDGKVVTQTALSKQLAVSVGLVNALLKRAAQRGLVKAQAAPYKRWAYYLTPRGFAEKGRLVAKFLESSLAFFRAARQEYISLFEWARTRGAQRFVLVGASELAEIAILAARECDAEILGIYDREVNQDRIFGFKVLRERTELEGSTLIITASRNPQEVFDQMVSEGGDTDIVFPDFLHISRVPYGPVSSEVASS